jgi:glycine dehydrogenase
MLAVIGVASLDELIDQTVPEPIRRRAGLNLPAALGEFDLIARLRGIAGRNQVHRSFIGMGYSGCITPPVIQRNILENPGWYTQYTPYQAEIAQGRLEALINFQTMVADLTGLPLANASLLDEATAAAEAMSMCRALAAGRRGTFLVDEACHPQTIAVVETRAEPLGIEVVVGPVGRGGPLGADVFGVLLQYPTTDGRIEDLRDVIEQAHAAGAKVAMATDLLALALLVPPGEIGADIAVGSSQRFGVPLGFGGPHAAFLSTREENRRHLPGRIIGVSRDARGRAAYRLSLQTREQHIRRDKATSNICTAQVLLAVMSSMYAVYHGPEGIERIARRVRGWTEVLAAGLERMGIAVRGGVRFDTLRIDLDGATRARVLAEAAARRMNLRVYADGLGVSLDETTRAGDVADLLAAFAPPGASPPAVAELAKSTGASEVPAPFRRQSAYLRHPVFHLHRSEHEMLRYMNRLATRDLSLTTSMIPLGSCTMKLNATTEMLPVTWAEFAGLHPFAPSEQAVGYEQLCHQLESWLAEITGFAAVSLQPNAGAQGEYAGLLVIRAYQKEGGQGHRDVCLIPTSAHGTNPASAVMAGMRVVVVQCDKQGNIDLGDLEAKAREHADRLSCLMVTYPSTHGVFETRIRDICQLVHEHGGQVYMDGANMNAQVGLCRPGDFGADVCHINLHKTFCIPHGGGGPGMGPIAVAGHLAPHLPRHPLAGSGGEGHQIGPVSAAPWGSASILPISWAYIAMMGPDGLKRASEVAILSANYIAARLARAYPVLYSGARGRVAHELILDLRPLKKSAGIEVDDVAKRLMDYGFHAPTMSFPVPGTLMIEPTESESLGELDRFCDAMLRIREEIRAVEEGRIDRLDNPLKNAPHTARDLCEGEWTHPYSRAEAAFPAPWLHDHKFWPPVARIDNAFGDRHLVCTCPPLAAYDSAEAWGQALDS